MSKPVLALCLFVWCSAGASGCSDTASNTQGAEDVDASPEAAVRADTGQRDAELDAAVDRSSDDADAALDETPDANLVDQDTPACVYPLSELTELCPATYSDGAALTCEDRFGVTYLGCFTAGRCGEHWAMRNSAGDDYFCLYDDSTQVLVGLLHTTDSPEFCDGTSFTRQAGTTVRPCTWSAIEVELDCGCI